MESEWIKFVETLGIGVACTIFFVWQSWKRESRLAERITALELFQEGTLVKLVEQTAKTIERATQALEYNSESWSALCSELRLRPCLKGSDAVSPCIMDQRESVKG